MKRKLFLGFFCTVFCLIVIGSAALAEYATLRINSSGADVLKMQQALIFLGYDVKADGKYGSATAAQVMQFQKDQGLTQDGVAGNKTLTRLYALSSSATTAIVKTAGSSLNLRATPSSSARIVTTIPNGREVTVYSATLSWAYVSYGSYTGYVSTSYLMYTNAAGNTPVTTPTATPVPQTAQPVITAAPAETAAVSTSGGSLNMRSSASTSSSIVTTIPNRKTVTVLEHGSQWSRVSYNGYTGYVMNKYLSFSTVSIVTATPKPIVVTAPPTPAVTTTQYATISTNGGSLNMRAQDKTSSTIITSVPNKSTVTILSRGDSWSFASYKGYTGYLNNTYLKFYSVTVTSAPTGTPVPVVTPAPTAAITFDNPCGTATIKTSGGTLNMRAGAGASYATVDTIPNGTVVPVYSYTKSWARILYNGNFGYVSSAYITYAEATAAPSVAPTQAVSGESDNEAAYDTSLFKRTLRSGYTGEDVKTLQERLVALNYLSSSAVTGNYDSTTISAVKSFQSIHGLSVDGLAGVNTFTALFSSSAIAYSDTISSFNTLHIYYRNADSQDTAAITRMQNRLSELGYTVNINGSFDETTYLAVLEFQLRNNMAVSGAATAAMQALLYSGYAAPASAAPSVELAPNEGLSDGPATGDVKLLHWFNKVKPSLKGGDTLIIYDPITSLAWNINVYSCGNHCDSQPAALTDTLIMNKAFGKPSWTVHTVYVQLPSGEWTMATMHNRPHLVGSITANGFDGHLCIHFLRDLDEVKKNDPNYGLTNQTTLRNSWKALTGITVN